MRIDSPWIVATAVALLIAGGFALDAVDLPGTGAPARGGPAGLASSGAWFCAAGDSSGGTLRVALAAPPSDGQQRAETAITAFGGGQRQGIGSPEVAAGSALVRGVRGGLEEPGATGRWWGWPAVATRLARLGGDGASGRLVAGPCPHRPARRWVVPGMATAGGATAEVVLANPYDTDAAVQVAVATPQGLREPRVLENRAVPARSTRTVSLNEHAPGQTDIGVIVTVRAGRVIAEGVQRLSAAIGGVNGASLAAAGRPATRWTVPWYRSSGQEVESWLWVTNPSEQPAPVSLTVHTGDRGSVPDALGEATVGPGQVRRLNLRNLVEAEEAAVTLVSENDVPLVVSGATRVDAGGEARTGLAVQRGVSAPDRAWVLTMPAGSERDTALHVVNPGGQPVRLDVALWADGQGSRPRQLQGVRVPPGGAVRRDLARHLPDVSTASAFVTASGGPVVAGMASRRTTGSYDLAAYAGIPAAVWRAGRAPDVRYEPSLTARIGPTPTPEAAGEASPPPVPAPTGATPTG